jgi:hypothetical protein
MSLGLFASLSLVLNVQPRESLARLQIAPGHHQPGPHPEGSPRHRRGGVLPCLPRPPAHFLLNTPTESQRIPSDWARGYPLVQLNCYPLTIFSFPHCKTPPVPCAKSQPIAAESSREQPRAAESSREQPRAAESSREQPRAAESSRLPPAPPAPLRNAQPTQKPARPPFPGSTLPLPDLRPVPCPLHHWLIPCAIPAQGHSYTS